MRKGFTIVELLIVIVVITILAAITIVVFNGMQDRAQVSQVVSALAQSDRKLKLYSADTGSYPATGNLSNAGVTDSDVSYQYTSNDGSSFCLTATTNQTSYHLESGSSTHVAGACAGHIEAGATITNYSVNPSGETTATRWSSWIGGSPSRTVNLQTTDPHSGSSYVRLSVNGSGNDGGLTYNFRDAEGTDGVNYRFSAYMRAPSAMKLYCHFGPGSLTVYDLPANTWTPISCEGGLDGWSARNVQLYRHWTNSEWEAGDWLDVDTSMITEGSAPHNYADGNSPGWSWNGTPELSTSTGPAL